MTSKQNSLRLWIQVVAVAGALALVQSLFSLYAFPPRYEWLLLAALALLTGSFSMKAGPARASITVSDTFFITTALLFGPAPATIANALGTVVSSWRRKHSLERVIFNTSNSAFSMWAGSQTFFWLSGVPPLTHSVSPIAQLILPLLAFSAVHYLINSGFIAVAIGLDGRKSPFAVWREHFLWL